MGWQRREPESACVLRATPSGPQASPAQNGKNDILGQSHYHRGLRCPCKCSSCSLARDLGRCLAGRLVVWLRTYASALHAHVVHSSLIAVVAVVSTVQIIGEGQA